MREQKVRSFADALVAAATSNEDEAGRWVTRCEEMMVEMMPEEVTRGREIARDFLDELRPAPPPPVVDPEPPTDLADRSDLR